MTSPQPPNDPHDPHAARNDPSNPGRDPYSDIFSDRPANPPQPEPAPDPYEIIEPHADANTHSSPPLDPAMMAPPAFTTPTTPTPPVIPGPIAISKSHNGGVILTLGILSLTSSFATFCCILIPFASIGMGIAAAIWATSDLRAINQGTMDPSGRSAVGAGRICGIIGIVIACLFLVLQIGATIFSLYSQTIIPPPPPAPAPYVAPQPNP